MKFYIGSTNGSGIKTNTFEDFVEYLRDMAETAEEQGEEWFEINVEKYFTDDGCLPRTYAELDYGDREDAEAIEGAKWDDINYRHYTER